MKRKTSKGPKMAVERRSVQALLADLERERQELSGRISGLQTQYKQVQEKIAALRWVTEPDAPVFRRADPPRITAARAHLPGAGRREVRETARELVEEVAPTLAARLYTVGDHTPLRHGSLPFQAREILRSEGTPLHADVLLERMDLAGQPAKRDSLVTALARLAASGRVFFRVEAEPNTFGLTEWRREK